MYEYLNHHIHLALALNFKATSINSDVENINHLIADGIEPNYIRNNLEYLIANAQEIISIAQELSDCLE